MKTKNDMTIADLYLNPDLERYIKNLQDLSIILNKNKTFDFFTKIKGDIYRQVKSRSTLRIQLDQEYFIKIHNKIGLQEFFKNIFSLNWPFVSAQQECNAIQKLKKIGINTLDIAGHGRKGLSSFIITKAINPNISLDELLLLNQHKPDYFKFKRVLIKFIAEVSKKMHANGLNHRDYYICHYLLQIDSQEQKKCINSENLDLNKIFLIDLHRMQIRKEVPRRFIIKDLSSLLFSVKKYNFTYRDYLRFIKNYSDNSIPIDFKFWNDVINKASQIREKG